MTIDHERGVPVYEQLAEILRAQIASGELQPERALPSGKTLVQRYGVARGTVDKAIAVLKAEGLVYVLHGKGVYVAKRERA
jgi:DNA-binding GntR family transcriptional regulator